jgi:hypothetical protein
VANILIPWGNVRSIVHFPQRNGYDYEEATKPLGVASIYEALWCP